MSTQLNFESFTQEAHTYVNDLAQKLDHPQEKGRVLMIWRAVMHTLRDRIHLGESFQILAPLPMIFKGIYVEGWQYNEQPPLDYDGVEQMKNEVKRLQSRYGEEEFPWKKSTEEIISITFNSLNNYLSQEQLLHVEDQFPEEIQNVLSLEA